MLLWMLEQRSLSRRFLQTTTAQVGLLPATCGDACGLDRRSRPIPRMFHAPKIGPPHCHEVVTVRVDGLHLWRPRPLTRRVCALTVRSSRRHTRTFSVAA